MGASSIRSPHAPTSQYQHNLSGEDNADAHMKCQIMGREVVVAIKKGSSISVRGNKSFMVSSTAAGGKERW